MSENKAGGHPKGLATLFLTEMWERASYYGLRALLVLFLVAAVEDGGFGLTDAVAASIYGLVMSGSMGMGFIGGWLGDRVLGPQRAILAGGLLIAAGNGLLAISAMSGFTTGFYAGLAIIVSGVGLLKTNINGLVHALYLNDPVRRDAGFTIYYMGINIGALVGTMLLPILATVLGWPIGFAGASLGMLAGIVQFQIMRGRLGLAGEEESQLLLGAQWDKWLIPVLMFLIVGLVYVGLIALAGIQPEVIAKQFAVGMGIVGVLYTAYLLLFVTKTLEERRRILAIVPILIAVVLFITGLDQAGASLNLFAQRFTDRELFSLEIPAGSFQSIYPLTIILFTPFLASFWTWLNRHKINYTATAKVGTGLVFMSLGFLLIQYAAVRAGTVGKVLPTWLLMTYMLHTVGDLLVGPVVINAVTKVAPKGQVGQLLGLLGIALAFGHNAAGLIVGQLQMGDLEGMQNGFMFLFWMTFIGGAVIIASAPLVLKLTKADI